MHSGVLSCFPSSISRRYYAGRVVPSAYCKELFQLGAVLHIRQLAARFTWSKLAMLSTQPNCSRHGRSTTSAECAVANYSLLLGVLSIISTSLQKRLRILCEKEQKYSSRDRRGTKSTIVTLLSAPRSCCRNPTMAVELHLLASSDLSLASFKACLADRLFVQQTRLVRHGGRGALTLGGSRSSPSPCSQRRQPGERANHLVAPRVPVRRLRTLREGSAYPCNGQPQRHATPTRQ